MVTQKIRFLREQKKLRHEDMAERLGISPSTYQRLESGETKMDVERLQKIAEVLEVSPDELLNSEPIVFNVSNNSGGAYANYGHIGHLVPEEFVEKLMDRYDAKHEAQVKNLEAMNQRLLDLLEKKLG
ncbi:MAG: helix-turn-helix domain-containing protein [Flavobacteriales bacterium]|nr:helix-turn-helix domain-containing protein [Flavobacteriales bacterium]